MDESRGEKGNQIVHGRVCAWRIRKFFESESQFVLSRVLISLDNLEEFSKAYNFAKTERGKKREAELLEERKKLEDELRSIQDSH